MYAVQNGLWWLKGDRGQQPIVVRLVRFLALVGSLAGLEGRVLLPSFGHYLGLLYPWNVIAISGALVGAGTLLLLHFEGVPITQPASGGLNLAAALQPVR